MEEDDLDFTPSPNTSSNLASLFGFTKKPLLGNSSLTYTAPKAPKRESSPSKKQSEEKTKWKIIFSKAVQAYKLEHRNYVNQGLIGIVLNGNHDSKIYEIILYKRTKERLCQIRISNNFSITLSANNYVSFYDNSKQNWSIMFQSSLDVEQFSQKVAICKFYSHPESAKSILIQDLEPASEQKTELNSLVEVIYHSFMLSPEEVSKLKGEIREKIKLSDYSFQYLSKGLVGCAENCKRIIIIPHSLAGPCLSELGTNKDLLIEAKVERILSEVERLTPTGDGPPESPVDSSTEETSIKARRASIKEALSSTKSQKANLISRMARMGQATLPLKQDLSTGQSDSEEESSVTSSPKPRLPRNRNTIASPPANYSLSQTQSPETAQLSVYQNDMSWHQAQLSKLGLAYQQLIPVSAAAVSSPTTDPTLSVYLSESRVQAAELRMGMSKISEKLDLVWSSIKNFSGPESIRNTNRQALMDSGGILTSIHNIIAENESLKEKVEEQKRKIEQQNDRIFHLLELNHKYLEQNSTSHEKQSQNESKLKTEMESLQRKELEMESANKIALDRVKNLEGNLAKSEKLNSELKQKMEDLNEEVEVLKKSLEGNSESTKELESFKEKITKAAETIIKLKERLREVTAENDNFKTVIKTQKEELETGSQKMEDSRTRNEEYEKAMESLKKRISEEKSKTESRIECLSRAVAKLEEEKKNLIETVEKKNTEKELENILSKILSVLKNKFYDFKEYSGSHIINTFDRIISNVITKGTVDESEAETNDIKNPEPTVVPAPRTSLQTTVPKDLKEEEISNEKSPPIGSESKEEEEKESDNSEKNPFSEKDGVDSRYKSYDQGWRTAKPPPPPLFDDDEDNEEWLY